MYLNTGLPFTDVPADSWFYEAVKFGYNEGLFQGVTETLFQPAGSMTRAMFVTTLARMDGAELDLEAHTAFADVREGSYYEGAVAWAVEAGIVKGTSATTFSPAAEITREQMVTMLCRYAKYLGEDTTADTAALEDFADWGTVSGWARSSMAWAVEEGIVNGTGVGLEPKGQATRAQGAQVLMNFALRED